MRRPVRPTSERRLHDLEEDDTGMPAALSRLAMLVALGATLVLIQHKSADAATCGARTLGRPFAPWLDPARYFLAPNGGFEDGAALWRLSGGAQVVVGNEPFRVGGAGDRHALRLGADGVARSEAFCVDGDEPTVRLFARNAGSVLSTLLVEARVRTSVLGVAVETTIPVGAVPGTATEWQPSLPFAFALSANQLLGGAVPVSFRFTVSGPGGDWSIDDVYVDPFKDR